MCRVLLIRQETSSVGLFGARLEDLLLSWAVLLILHLYFSSMASMVLLRLFTCPFFFPEWDIDLFSPSLSVVIFTENILYFNFQTFQKQLLMIAEAHLLKEKTSQSIQDDDGGWCIRHHLLGCCLLAQVQCGLHATQKDKKVSEAIRCFFRYDNSFEIFLFLLFASCGHTKFKDATFILHFYPVSWLLS